MSSSKGEGLILYSLVGGPAMLAWGLAKIKQKRLIQGTPTSKIRSAAMGLVELKGLAKPRREIREPLDRAPCCWWRCRVQEYRSNGKSGSWVTLKEMDSAELLYIEDETGKLLVDPRGADLYLNEDTTALSSFNRTAVEPVLGSWGIDCSSWFGISTKRIRIIREMIGIDHPLYVLGELTRCVEHLRGRGDRLAARMRDLKKDPARMTGIAGADGVVDSLAWDALVREEEGLFARAEAEREARIPDCDRLVIQKPADRPFIISIKTEEELAGGFGWKAFFLVFGGILATGAGTALALARGYSVQTTAIFVAVGFVAGMLVRHMSVKSRTGGITWDWLSLS